MIRNSFKGSVLFGGCFGSPNIQTLSLMRIIGSPLVSDSRQKSLRYSKELYLLARENKIPLAYLDVITSCEKTKVPEYDYYLNRAQRKIDIIAEISNLFKQEDIDYAVLQMLESRSDDPDDNDILHMGLIFRDPDDIDILHMGSAGKYHEVIKILTDVGYKHLETAPYCAKFLDRQKKIVIDVKNEISISYLIYVNKREMDYCLKTIRLPWEVETKVLNPEAHFLVILANSVMGKNAYRLADYYFALYCFAQMDEQQVQGFVRLIKKNCLKNAARWFLTLTLLLHMIAHRMRPRKIAEALSMIGAPCTEACQAVNTTESPYPCDFKTLSRAFGEKLRDMSFRQSIPRQVPRMLTPTFIRRLLERIEK